jgi:ADP-ribose pyrophosphatase
MSEEKKPEAKIIGRERVYDGFFKVDLLTIEMDKHDGGTQVIKRENFDRGNAVGILAYDPDRDEVLLGNEMRTGILAAGEDPFSDSVPAGMIDKGETPVQAAVRELHEEAGLVLNNPRVIHPGAFVSAGGCSEKIALVFGTVDMKKAGGVHGEAAEGESIKSIVVKADEFLARAEDGRLRDMKSLACAFWLALHRDELRKPADPDTAIEKKITNVLGR